MKKLIAAALMLASLPAACFAISASSTLINSNGLAYSSAPAQNLLNFAASGGVASKLSAQITFSTAAIAAQNFNGGQVSTGSITVVSTQSLVAAAATDTLTLPTTAQILGSPATGYITVVATTGLQGFQATFTTTLSSFSTIQSASPSITLDGQNTFTYAGNWASTTTTTLAAAANLVTAINASGVFTATTAVVNGSTQVVVTYVAYGSGPNGFQITSSSAALVSTGTWKGGANPVFVTINNGNNFVFTYGGNWASSNSVTGAAFNLSAVVNAIGGAAVNPIDGSITSTNVAGVVYATADVNGTFANSWTLATSSSALVSVSSSVFLGGVNPILRGAYFSIAGTHYLNGNGWTDASGSSTQTAVSIVNFLNRVATTVATVDLGYANVTATCATQGTVVTLTAGLPGSAGNLVSLSSSPGSGLAVGTPFFTGGQDNASFTIGGIVFSYPTQWNLGVSSTVTSTAGSIAGAISSNSVTNAVMVATNTLGVVNATGTIDGVNTNYSLTSSTISLAVVGFTGGSNPAYSSGSATIAIATHNFTTALPVLLSTSTGAPASGFLTGTTYYVVVVDANDIKLATSSAQAQLGVGTVWTSTDTTTAAHTYTLTPPPYIQGPASGGFQVSNDGTNWANLTSTVFNVTVSSNIFTPVNPSSTTTQDFGMLDYNWIRYNVTPPTQGGIVLKVILTAKD